MSPPNLADHQPIEEAATMPDPSHVKSVAVHPGIGVARIGNAAGEEDYFFGPEVPGAGPHAAGGFRNASGGLKRQATRFRIYATLQNDEVVEVTAKDAGIEWRVELANLKAGWYRFTTAMDLARHLAVSTTRRNPEVGRDNLDIGFLDRASLDIVPSRKTISGTERSGGEFAFDDGEFFGKKVYLGELRTDDQGRLLVLGGRGATGTQPVGKVAPTFANNDGWHDDVADGPVRATVTIGDRIFEADPGYVVVTPPNYGPSLFGVLTMDDVAHEAFYAAGFCRPPERPSFTNDIWPIFDRLSGNQWVNHGIFLLHGHGSPLDARAPEIVKRLADPSNEAKPFRQAVFKLFRDPEAIKPSSATLPPFYGDGVDYGFGAPLPLDTSADLSLTVTLHRMLGQWADGQFESDWQSFPVLPDFDRLPPVEQCRALDRANLYDLLGGPFHPGIELTWIMRQPSLWRAPYRLKLAPEGVRARQDFGSELTPEICLAASGPLSETGAGALTRWLGVPWQTDAGSCASGGEYTPTYYLSVPSFWGARVPNDVLPQAALQRLVDPALNPIQRAKHFDARKDWYRLIQRRSGQTRAQAMVEQWWRLGIVEPVEASAEHGFGGVLHIEIPTADDQPQHDPTLALITSVEQLPGQQPAELERLAAAPPLKPPSSKTFKRPRIHYGPGDI
jgi:hypothetical protein